MAHLFNRLLLATEHSEFDTGAEAMAFALAKRCQLPLATVVPLLSNPEYEALAPQIAAKAEQEAAVKIARLREQAADVGVTIDLRLRRGEEPYQEIVQEAMQQGSDLIIIRRRGKRGFLANLLVGEMVSKVVAHAPCHVLIVPRGKRSMWSAARSGSGRAYGAGTETSYATATAVAAAECGLPLQLVSVVHSLMVERPRKPNAFVADMLGQGAAGAVSRRRREVRSGKPFTELLAASAACQC
jgi:nucleotide-binding universal stress UspA family protein